MKDKLVIFLLKIKRFVIKNKIAVGVVTLLLIASLVVYKIVFAGEDIYADKISISGASISSISTGTSPFDTTEDKGCSIITNPGCDESSNDNIVRTFDTFDINIGYTTILNDTISEATTLQREIVFVIDFPDNYIVSENNLGIINLRPIMLNGDMTYTVVEEEGNTNKFAITVVSDISYNEGTNPTSSESQNLKFQVGGAPNNADLTPESIEVYESTKKTNATSSTISEITNGQIVVTSKVSIEAKLVGSYAFKKELSQNRTIPFGVLVKLVGIGDSDKGVKGATYPLSFDLDIDATRSTPIGQNTTLTYTEGSAILYQASSNLFGIPNGIITNDYDSSIAAYNSGEIVEDQTDHSILTISGMQSNGIFPRAFSDEENIIGTYYGEFLSIRGSGDVANYTITISVKDNGDPIDGVNISSEEITIKDNYLSNGYTNEITPTTTTSISIKDSENSATINSISDGEISFISLTSVYGKSADKVSNVKLKQGVIIPKNMLFLLYGDNAEDPYFVVESNIGLTTDDITTSIYISDNDELDENDENITFDELISGKDEEQESLEIEKHYIFVIFETDTITTLNPSTWIKYSFRNKLSEDAPAGAVAGKYTYQSEFTIDNVVTLNATDKELLYTAFKAKTDLELKDSEGNTDFSSSYDKALTWSISPTVKSNIDILNAADLNLANITINAYISPGLNYTANSQYLEPDSTTTQSGGEYNGYTKLTYILNGYKINDYIDQIYFDTYIDLKATTTQRVVIIINAETESGKTDSSNISERTTSKEIYIFGSSAVMFRQVAVTPIVKYSDNMNINYKTEIYNGTESDIATISTINILPYNGDSNSDYNGSYYLESTPNGAYCTNTAASTFINHIDTYASSDEWYLCSNNDTKEKKAMVTAIKVDKALSAGAITDVSFTLNADDAENGDVFSTTAYVKYDNIYEVTNSAKAEISAIRLTGKVWEDFSYDGERDSTERELSDIVLELYDSEDVLIDETTSNENGNYSFNSLETGKSYYVKARYDSEKYFPTKINESLLPAYKSVFTSQTEGDEVYAISPSYTVGQTTTSINNINLGLALKKTFALSINKYITKVVVSSIFAADKVYTFDKVKTAKIDVKDMSKVTIKVVYTLEIENIKYYPGYATEIIDYAPSGMAFDEDYVENEGWEVDDNGFLVNRTLSDEIIYGGDKKYLTIAFYITSKEAGEFVNSASIYDLQPLVLGTDE